VLTEAAAGLAELGAGTGDRPGGSEATGEAPAAGREDVP
jgi:hypothetical protein